MVEICPKCGLPEDICVCSSISKEQQKIKVRVETRKWGHPVTIIEGIDKKDINIEKLAKNLKSLCACGGSLKEDRILLQGDHRSKTRTFLAKYGFRDENIEVT